MATTIIGQKTQKFPAVFAAPTVSIKQKWSDAWRLEPDLTVVSFGFHVGAVHSTCDVERRYGHVKMPFEKNFPADRTAVDYGGQWLQVKIAGDNGQIVAFLGQIDNTATSLTGNATDPSGHQHFIATGGLKLLEKISISDAYFLNAGRLEWLPAMNKRDKRGFLVGNMEPGGTMYGGKAVWNHLQYLQYIVNKFIQQPGGPKWTVGGQTDILAGMQTTIDFPPAPTAVQMLQHLIPVNYGVDFMITPTDAGYEITLFAMTSLASPGIAGVSIPVNNRPPVKLIKDDQRDLIDVQLVESTERKVDKIQIIGKRIVVCGSLSGLSETTVSAATLEGKWADALETDYINAGGLVDNTTDFGAEDYDKARKNEKYRDVYSHFGAPSNWDFEDGKWQCYCAANGDLRQGGAGQNLIRETLNWIPLKEGFDYTTNPPTDHTDGFVEPDLKHPIAWIKDEVPDSFVAAPTGESSSSAKDGRGWVQCDLNQMHVSRPLHDFGIVVDASPAHKIALNHWTTDQLQTTALDYQRYDFNTLVATFAIESDHRIRLIYDLSGTANAAGDGSVKTIVDDEAEMWVLLGGSVVGVTQTQGSIGDGKPPPGQLVKSPTKNMVLRNDISRLALAMAGEISRYTNERARSTLKFKGFKAWTQMLGSILTTIEQGDTIRTVGAPITSIEWILSPSPETTIKAGYA